MSAPKNKFDRYSDLLLNRANACADQLETRIAEQIKRGLDPLEAVRFALNRAYLAGAKDMARDALNECGGGLKDVGGEP